MAADIPVEIDVQTVKNMMDRGEDFMLLDCREPDEFEFVHIDGSVHIPMQQIPQHLERLSAVGDQPIVVHCHHGGRSLRVTHWLRQQGFRRAQNMSGGIDAWSQEIDPQLPRY